MCPSFSILFFCKDKPNPDFDKRSVREFLFCEKSALDGSLQKYDFDRFRGMRRREKKFFLFFYERKRTKPDDLFLYLQCKMENMHRGGHWFLPVLQGFREK
jgi:hypothetical protein